MTKHFLKLGDLTSVEIESIILDAISRKKKNSYSTELQGKYLALIFEKSSTRTRVSFEVAMSQLGGKASFLSIQDLQLGRGEPIQDTAKVISSMADAIVLRTLNHKTIVDFAEASSSPIINGLTDLSHPCQLLADLLTYKENRGSIKGKKVTWIGDCNNMCKTYIEASDLLDFELHIACPTELSQNITLPKNTRVTFSESIENATEGSHLVTTDVWISMGDEEHKSKKSILLKDYKVTPELMDGAEKDAIFLHCLPAQRGHEISETMLDDPRSFVWEQAENRLHVQKSLLIYMINN